MSHSPTSEPESAFVCDCEEWMREACAGKPFYRELEDKRYCVLHCPGKEKSADFEPAFQRKLADQDFDFRGVWFPDKLLFEKVEFRTKADFRSATFSAEANFIHVTFSAEAHFSSATFSAEAHFNSATFSAEAHFIYGTFSREADFIEAIFNALVDFSYVTFSVVADFSSATFAEADFNSATFADHVGFEGDEKHQVFTDTFRLDLQFARIEKPDRVSFHTLSLRPHSFVNVDPRKFDFTM